jgi:hypothetical protein
MPESLLENAKLSICMGIEDYEDSRPGRKISAIRNLYAGILLLLKEKLRRLSPGDEILLAERIKPIIQNGSVKYVDGNQKKKTVDYNGIKDRFRDLGIKVNFAKIGQIKELRNNFEHYFQSAGDKAVSDAFHKSVLIINPFVKNHLEITPEDFLGNEHYEKIVSIADQNQEERKVYRESITDVSFLDDLVKEMLRDGFCCPNCRVEELFEIQGADQWNFQMNCLACGQQIILEEHIEKIIDEHYWEENINAYSVEEKVNQLCPECQKETYICTIDKCVLCGYQRQHEECARCYGAIGLDEQDFNGLCGYCHNLMSKDD